EPEASPPPRDGDGGDDAEDTADSVRSLLKGALGGAPDSSPDVLAGVQKKLRDRSGGKFYADEWSTAKPSPTLTFLVTSALMFAIVLLAYAVLSPLSSKPERVKMEPQPVEILAPPR
ncbi:MAG TPA: hypothetical protein VF395_20025, partial [Polyangiaceae bacterium]